MVFGGLARRGNCGAYHNADAGVYPTRRHVSYTRLIQMSLSRAYPQGPFRGSLTSCRVRDPDLKSHSYQEIATNFLELDAGSANNVFIYVIRLNFSVILNSFCFFAIYAIYAIYATPRPVA